MQGLIEQRHMSYSIDGIGELLGGIIHHRQKKKDTWNAWSVVLEQSRWHEAQHRLEYGFCGVECRCDLNGVLAPW